jgi:hypothetical protein
MQDKTRVGGKIWVARMQKSKGKNAQKKGEVCIAVVCMGKQFDNMFFF